MATILYLTDLYYPAQGRNYYEEDLYITSRLLDHFDLLIGHPRQVLSYLEGADLIAGLVHTKERHAVRIRRHHKRTDEDHLSW